MDESYICHTFRLKPNKVPEIIVSALTLRNIIMRLGFYSMNNIGEFNGILNEENGDIVSNEVPDTFVGVELDCEPSNIANSVLKK
jgi:hypothetical protein